jgi:hypothetical protein
MQRAVQLDRMTDKRRSQSPVEEGKLKLVREFLQREFRNARHHDYFDQAKMAQVFVLEPSRGPRHILLIPKSMFDHDDFLLLMDGRLADGLQESRDVPRTLTPEGLD